MKKTIVQNIIFAIAAIVVYKVLFAPTDIKTDISKYEKQIITLEQKIDSLHSLNLNLKDSADSLTLRVSLYDEKIKNLNIKIYAIKKETQRQLNAVDNFGNDELEQFFSNRYGYDKDSIN
jgi:hypothetical protein|tara:strand:- start:831 stop:1190 length:360 start_codon:yes stop_codon:yes gene_type:complete